MDQQKLALDLKTLLSRKLELIGKLEELRNSVSNGQEFFRKQYSNPDPKNIVDGVARLLEIMNEVNESLRLIKGLDILIAMRTEMESENADFKFSIPEHPNDAGDVVKDAEIFLTSEKSNENSIDIHDLWTIIMLKEMFDVKNVEVLPKREEQ